MSEKGGFTLVELILVMVIIGILAGAVTLSVAGRQKEAKIHRANADIVVYQDAIDLYAIDHNDQYPNALTDLVGGERTYVRALKNDPWNNPYVYRYPGRHRKDSYDILSRGPDGVEGTADDITSWATETSRTQ